jgi:hypothetical protein
MCGANCCACFCVTQPAPKHCSAAAPQLLLPQHLLGSCWCSLQQHWQRRQQVCDQDPVWTPWTFAGKIFVGKHECNSPAAVVHGHCWPSITLTTSTGSRDIFEVDTGMTHGSQRRATGVLHLGRTLRGQSSAGAAISSMMQLSRMLLIGMPACCAWVLASCHDCAYGDGLVNIHVVPGMWDMVPARLHDTLGALRVV